MALARLGHANAAPYRWLTSGGPVWPDGLRYFRNPGVSSPFPRYHIYSHYFAGMTTSLRRRGHTLRPLGRIGRPHEGRIDRAAPPPRQRSLPPSRVCRDTTLGSALAPCRDAPERAKGAWQERTTASREIWATRQRRQCQATTKRCPRASNPKEYTVAIFIVSGVEVEERWLPGQDRLHGRAR